MVVRSGQSPHGANVLKMFNTDPPGMASVKCPRDRIAELAEDSTIAWIAFATSSSVARMCTRSAGAACSGGASNDDDGDGRRRRRRREGLLKALLPGSTDHAAAATTR